MDQERIITLLGRKLAKEASPDELRELDELFKIYPDSVYYEQAFEELWERSEMEPNNTDAVFERHRAKYSDEFGTEERVKRNTPYYLLVACVISLTIVGFGFYFYTRSLPSADQGVIEISAGKGIRKKILLPDSSQVWLNSNSKLTYSKNISSGNIRRVSLTGEAFFDVKKDKKHPFIIQTDKFSIKVLGTSFNVRTYPNENRREATLIHGLIELSLNDQPEQKIILRPNEKLALSDVPSSKNEMKKGALTDRTLVIENIKPVKISNTMYLEEIAWVENNLVFNNITFEQLVPKLESWYNLKITLKNDVVKNYRFTGVFTTESISQALMAMKLIKPFTFKIEENEVIIN